MLPSQTSHRQRLSFYRVPIYSVQVPGKRTSSPGSSEGLLWREMSISRAFLYVSFRTLVKEPSLHVPLSKFPQTDAPFLEPSFICISKSPVKQGPSLQVAQPVPTDEWCPFPKLSVAYVTLFPCHLVPNEHGLSVKQNLIFLSKSPLKEPPVHYPPTGPLWGRSFSRTNGLFIH